MRRRQFLAGIGATSVWAGAATAQQVERVRRIGLLNSLSAGDLEAQARNAAFLQRLQQLGWEAGRNLQVDTRWGGGDSDHVRKLAYELAALAPDVIFATGGISVAPLLQATGNVPIVFAIVPDPVGRFR